MRMLECPAAVRDSSQDKPQRPRCSCGEPTSLNAGGSLTPNSAWRFGSRVGSDSGLKFFKFLSPSSLQAAMPKLRTTLEEHGH